MSNNNVIIFVSGLLLGTAAGATGVYFYTRKQVSGLVKEIDTLIVENESIRKDLRKDNENISEETDKNPEEVVEAKKSEDDGDEAIKKYHHYQAATGGTVQSLFEKRMVEEDIKKVAKEKTTSLDLDYIDEFEEEEFDELVKSGDADVDMLRYDANKDILYWGYGTDTEGVAEEHYGFDRTELIGNCWRWASDYITNEEECTGEAFIYNKNLNKYFDIVMFFDADGEFVNED